MSLMKKYSVIAHCMYRDREYEYEEASFDRIADARAFMRDKCYPTPTRTYSIKKNF